MAQLPQSPSETHWSRLDAAAFGVLYGGITVLALLLAMADHPETGFEMAIILFGSVFAITAAKAFADAVSAAISNGTRIDRVALRNAWHHARPTLVAANLPTVVFLAAGLGIGTLEGAIAIAQIYCVALLMLVGARAAWLLDQSVVSALLGALFTGSVGCLLAGMKYVLH